MEQLDRPDEITWDERRLWFEEQDAAFGAGGVAALSEQACALMPDLQAAFCAGAWSAVVILSAAIVESQLRSTGKLPNALADQKVRWLRQLRNDLLHENPKSPALTVEDQWTARSQWERDAKRAIETALAVLYQPETREA